MSNSNPPSATPAAIDIRKQLEAISSSAYSFIPEARVVHLEQAISLFNEILEQHLAEMVGTGSSPDSATPTAQGHEADNFNPKKEN